MGHAGTIIGCHFGLPTSIVSRLLKSAMHKLGFKTQAQLVAKIRGLPRAHADNGPA
jgi:DNA-binding CsgD family transcriptional regulator